MPLLGNVVIQKIPMITQDLSRRSIEKSGESVSTYPRRPKAEAFSNAVDLVERLCNPIDPRLLGLGVLLGNVVIRNFPTITQDLSRRCIATRRESVSTYPHRPKAEALAQRG